MKTYFSDQNFNILLVFFPINGQMIQLSIIVSCQRNFFFCFAFIFYLFPNENYNKTDTKQTFHNNANKL